MKQYISYILLFCLGLFVSCSEDSKNSMDVAGYIHLGVAKNDVLLTKAGIPVTDQELQVFFINSESDTVKQYKNYVKEVEGKNILLPVGEYTVQVSSAPTLGPQWENPAYMGDTTVTVVAGEYAKAEVECFIANTKVTVEFTSKVKQLFSEYVATVSNKDGFLVYDEDHLNSAGYFSPEKLTVSLRLVNKENGLVFNMKKVFPDIQSRYHYKLKFDVATPDDPDNPGSGENLDVVITKDSTNVECLIPIPQYGENSDLYKIPEFSLKTITSDNLFLEGYEFVLTKMEDTPLIKEQILSIGSDAGLKSLYVKLSDTFGDSQSMFDLMKQGLDLLPKIESDDTKIVSINLTNLVNSFVPSDKTPQIYTIGFIALDTEHQEKELNLTYTVKPNLPLFAEDISKLPAYVWANFVLLKGSAQSEEGLGFKYRKVNGPDTESSWTKISIDTSQKDENGIFTKLVVGLTPDTEYVYRVYDADTESGDSYFSTMKCNIVKGDTEIPNLDFDNWNQLEWDGNKNIWYPSDYNSDGTYWDSGNAGAITMGKSPTSPVDEAGGAFKGKAAKMVSQYVGALGIGKFAAGNLFTGQYKQTFTGLSSDKLGARIHFGSPFVSKPTQLKGKYKYTTGGVPGYNPKGLIKNGEKDSCAIYIALSDKSSPYEVNTLTGESTFINYETDPNILAYGELDATKYQTSSSMSDYVDFTIDIKYYKDRLNRVPKYIIIVSSASKYGDYFTGAENSILYVDEFKLIYDYNPESFVGTILEDTSNK